MSCCAMPTHSAERTPNQRNRRQASHWVTPVRMDSVSMRPELGKLVAAFVVAACQNACAQVSSPHASYALVDRKGVELDTSHADPRHGMFLRRTRPDGSVKDFRVPEFDRMHRQHDFGFELIDGSLLSAPQGDYVAVRATRSIAWHPEDDADYMARPSWWEHRCGHAVDMTFLVRVLADAASIVKRNAVECGSGIRIVHTGGENGYETTRQVGGAGKSMLYLLQKNGSFIEKDNGPSR